MATANERDSRLAVRWRVFEKGICFSGGERAIFSRRNLPLEAFFHRFPPELGPSKKEGALERKNSLFSREWPDSREICFLRWGRKRFSWEDTDKKKLVNDFPRKMAVVRCRPSKKGRNRPLPGWLSRDGKGKRWKLCRLCWTNEN